MSTTLQDVQQHYQEDIHTEETGQDSTEIMNKNVTPPPLRILLSVATGIMFGIALEKGRVFEPQVIRDQMLFRRFAMMKMFLSASALGMICFSILSVMPQTLRKMGIALQRYPEGPSIKSVLGVILGSTLLGSGMTIAGACPGTVFVQLGARVSNAWIAIAGCVCGGLFYALTQSHLSQVFSTKLNPHMLYLNKYLNVPYSSIAIPLSCVMALAIFGLELFTPWDKEVDPSLLGEGVMRVGAWPPFVAGMIVGMLQVPTVLTNEDTLGSATSYVTVASLLWPSSLFGNVGEVYLKRFRYGLSNWWQVLHVGGAVCGGFLSALASNTLGTVPGLPWYHAFGGGFLMLFGARLAGGCTSGHGLSGMGLLALMSFAAVPPMFGGGIITAFVMKYGLGVDM